MHSFASNQSALVRAERPEVHYRACPQMFHRFRAGRGASRMGAAWRPGRILLIVEEPAPRTDS